MHSAASPRSRDDQRRGHTYVYTYDLAGRLITANEDAAPITYAYDSNSNRTSYSGPLGSVASTTYDAQDRLVQYGTTTYAYDNHGDLATRTQGANSTQYTYDEFGNLTRVVLPGGTQIDYLIDAMDRRIGKKVDGTLVRRWLYDGQLRMVAELDGAGALLGRFVYANKVNVPEYVVQGATTYRLITDYLGSPRLLINTASGAIAGMMNHDEYGRVTQDTLSSLLPFGYAGGHYDPDTGLVRFGVRDYDPETGRWTAKDPLLFAGRQENLYAYAGSAPTHYVDPTGLSPVGDLLKDTGKATVLDQKPATDPVENALESLVTKNPVGEITVGTTKLAITGLQSEKFFRIQEMKLVNIIRDECVDPGTRMIAVRLYRSLESLQRRDGVGVLQWQQHWDVQLNVLRQRTAR